MSLPIRNAKIRIPQGQIFWREVGQGIPLIFLHGSSQESSQWLPLLEKLGRNYHCFAPDLLGFGESEHPKVHHSIAWHLETLVEYVNALHLHQYYLVGHSLGGWIAASYALKNLDKVQGIILIAPEGVAILKGKRLEKWLINAPELLIWLIQLFYPFWALLGLKSKIKQILSHRQKLKASPATYQLLFRRRHSEIQAELLQEQLPFLNVPTLIFQGEQDTTDTLTHAQTYAELAPFAKLHLLPDRENDWVKTAPDILAQEIINFLSSQESEWD